ncbi:MAG: aldehyde ferredoxin oxidoreductase C-terminal domain-containing protein, partial [Nitrospinota bacterium]
RRFMEEPIPDGPSKGMVIPRDKLDLMLDEYYEHRGWDKETGIPTREKLKSLGLEDTIPDLWRS